MSREATYIGIDKDPTGAMNPTGNLIRDAWVFGFLDESETCEGWSRGRVEALYDQVHNEWQKYGMLASNLPDELREKHHRIYQEAIRNAREKGWDPEKDYPD